MWALANTAEAHGPETKSRSWVSCWPGGHSAFLSEQEAEEGDPLSHLIPAPCPALYLPCVI